ncbi:alpha/beta fold hydrolase [Streptomyces sp. NPDC004539]|uniref:thioesterase II family protein n=1 Tax=Streptomyces sp. NPDC004539 TaxID=3154280 RepID=UPI00339F84F5
MPYTGVGASLYAAWPGLLPDDVEPIAVQLPGREDRLFDPHVTDVDSVARALADVLRPRFSVPVAFFGHCAGALLAFEVARELEVRYGVRAAHLIVSAAPAPDSPVPPPPLHTLSDAEFRAVVRASEGAPQEVLDSDAYMELLLPGMRADFAMWSRYRHRPGAPLTCPVTVFGGADDDEVTAPALRAWQAHTTGAFAERVFPGGHFFLRTAAEEVTGAVAELLAAPSVR